MYIFCRFLTNEDLDEFNKLNAVRGIYIHSDMTTYNLDTGSYTCKRLFSPSTSSTLSDVRDEFWLDMPRFYNESFEFVACIKFITNVLSIEELEEIFSQKMSSKMKSVRFPKRESKNRYLRVIGGDNPKYPIYVVSRGRYDEIRAKTVKELNMMNVPHFVVVEPDEYDLYKNSFDSLGYTYSEILKLDMSYKDNYDTLDDRGDSIGKGPGGARNFCWDDSIRRGFSHHWVLDDNIEWFRYFTDNFQRKMRTAVCFKASEDFFTRFKNVAMGSLQYTFFLDSKAKAYPFVMNTRMYSIIFIRNDIPYRWRGRYNEDTILSLDCLSNGLCTIQICAFSADKITTQRVKGGNTDMFYSIEGTDNKSQMLVDVYPQFAQKVFKYNRIHHYVDYSAFNMQLEYRDDFTTDNLDKVNNYGMRLVNIPKEWDGTYKDSREYIESHLDECDEVDMFNILL